MGDIVKGLEAGFLATVVLSIVMVGQQALLPEVNIIAMWTSATNAPDFPMVAWILHFAVGAGLWGSGFAVFSPHLPGPHWLRGIAFSLLTWLAMMIVFLPSAGMPMFAAGLGPLIPLVTLGLFVIYGAVLGETYHLLLHYLPSEVDENA